jgi:hypothetical protein
MKLSYVKAQRLFEKYFPINEFDTILISFCLMCKDNQDLISRYSAACELGKHPAFPVFYLLSLINQSKTYCQELSRLNDVYKIMAEWHIAASKVSRKLAKYSDLTAINRLMEVLNYKWLPDKIASNLASSSTRYVIDHNLIKTICLKYDKFSGGK